VGRAEEGAKGWEMLFWPVMWVPSDRETLMWWEKFVLMAGRTVIVVGTLQTLLRR
jgi:hypothetical protein